MFCKFCQKEQEYVRVGGKTHCASCGGVLEDTGASSDAKTPEITPEPARIETEILPHAETSTPPEIQELAAETKISAHTREELEGSAILLDILSDNATDLKTDSEIGRSEDLIAASGATIDYLSTVSDGKLQDAKPKSLNDITPAKVVKRDDYLDKYFKGSVKKVEEEVVGDVKKIEETVGSQKGAVRESTALEMGALVVLIGITVTLLIFLFQYFI